MDDKYYMKIAIEAAKEATRCGEVPIGAVVVQNPVVGKLKQQLINTATKSKIIAVCGNKREANNDPSAHAEVLAIKKASEVLGRWRLSDCTIFVTLEPCIMCAGLIHQSRIERCVFGASDPKAGALGSLYQINEDMRLNHQYQIQKGVMHEECAQLLKDFFKSRRQH